MSLKIKLFFCVALLLSTLADHVNAQGNRFLEARVFLSAEDTISGYVKNVGELERSRFVVFKSSEESDPVTYYPKDIEGYLIGGKQWYKSGSVQMKGSDADIPVFLKIMVDGDVLDLFQLNFKPREESAPFYQYSDKFYVFKAASQTRTLLLDKESSQNYINQLPVYLDECEPVLTELKSHNYSFTDRGLTNFVKDYNQCQSSTSRIYTDLEKKDRTIKFIAKAGVTISSISPTRLAYRDFEYSKGVRPTLSFLVDIPIYKIISIRGGLNYLSRKTTGKQTVIVSGAYDNEGEVLELEANLSFNHIAVPLEVVVTAPLKTVKPYLFAGGSFGVAVGNSVTGTRTNFMSFPGPPSQVLQYADDITPFPAKVAVYDLAWRVGGGITYPLNDQLDLLLEVQYIDGKNDASKGSAAFFSSKTLVITGGIEF